MTTKPNGLDVQTEGETISLGFFHTCGISTQGAAHCWGGYESLDLVGDGAVKVQTTPTAIAGGQAFSQISAGGRHTCALTSSGAAFCWGSNYVSQLGDGTTDIRSSPVAVSGGHIFRQIDSGSLHTCGITPSGEAFCWGALDGESRAAPGGVHRVPIAVGQGLVFRTISAGNRFTCGITTLGAAYCWGDNAFGRLGTGTTTTSSAIAAPVAGALTFARISTGANHACGLTTSGAAVCWGRNELLALGDSTREPFRSSPTVVAGGYTFTQIASGNEYTCALTPSGAAYCWGHGSFGQLGNGSNDAVSTPTAVAGGLSFKRISVGSGHAAAITHAGAAYAWGTNWQGQLGDGTQAHRYAPVRAAIGLIFK